MLLHRGGGNASWFDNLMPIIGTHATIDLALTKKLDIKIHHLCIFGVFFYNYYYQVSPDVRIIFSYPMIKTEISSIFLVLKEYIPKNSVWYTANSAIFYATFFKFRIFDFYSEIIHNHDSLNSVIWGYSSENPLLSALLVTSCYGLYILNIYWFYIINKILYKGLTKLFTGINTDQMCHLLCSYIHILNIPLAIYVYSQQLNEKYLFDMIGVTTLTVTSFLYHHDIYKRLSQTQITEYSIPDKDNYAFFLHDCVFINVRSFLTTVTCYYNHPQLFSILVISSMTHLTSIYRVVLNLFEVVVERGPENETEKHGFLQIHNVITILPIGLDILLVFANSYNEAAVPFLSVNIAIALLFVVEPFYKLNHVAFHLLLVAQNYYLCLSHRGL